MRAGYGFKDKKTGRRFLFAFLCGLFGLVTEASGDMMSVICNNQVVSVGDRRGEVLAKCGNPLSKSQDASDVHALQTKKQKHSGKKKDDRDEKITVKKKTVKERAETWTYNIDGSYRFFIFKEGRLAEIEAGGLVK